MRLADLRIVAEGQPGCVVEGQFRLESPHYPGGEPVPSAGAEISLSMGSRYGAWLVLHDLTQDASGLFSRAGQGNRLSIHLPGSINLERLLMEMSRSPASPGRRRVEGVQVSAQSELGFLNGWIAELEIETQVLDAGLGVRFSGDVALLTQIGPIGTPPSADPALADSRIRADIVVPWAFFILQGSELANLGRTPAIRDERTDTLFDFGLSGLAGLAIDRSLGHPYFLGRLSVEKAGMSRACIAARITDTMLELTSAPTPWVYADGSVTSNGSHGPKLTLFGMGYDAWTKALSGETTGRFEMRGDCVGFVTEAWIGEAVAGRHAVTACTLDIALGETELVLTVRGEIGGLLQYSGPPLPPKYGPGFEAKVIIPTLYLTVRGIDLLSWGVREHRLLKGESNR